MRLTEMIHKKSPINDPQKGDSQNDKINLKHKNDKSNVKSQKCFTKMKL